MRSIIYVFTALTLLLVSCKSDEEKIKDANAVVEKFVHEILLENFDAANSIYPKFQKLGEYWIPREFEIENTMIESDGSISIYGSYEKFAPKRKEELKFIIKDIGKGLQIINSKGLSTYYNSPLFEYCKRKGFLDANDTEENSIDYDGQIAKICQEHKFELELLVDRCARFVSENVVMNKQQTTLQLGYFNDSYSGTISIINNTGFDISNSSFDFNIYWFKGGIQSDVHNIQYLYQINAFTTINHEINYENLPSRANRYNFGVTLDDEDAFAAEVVRKLEYSESL